MGTAPRAAWLRSGGAPLGILLALLGILCVAGGASRADTIGQAIVRAASLAAVMGFILTGARADVRGMRAPLAIVAAAALLVGVQLIPLPFVAWTGFPGRDLIADITRATGPAGLWRPAAIVPDGALNGLFSLLVPLAVLLVASGLRVARGPALLPCMIALVGFSALCGLLQLSGGALDNPFINDSPGEAAGSFANRNHQALFLAIGVPLALTWGFAPGRRLDWRASASLGTAVLLSLLIVGTGSRAGLILLAAGLMGGGFLAWPALAGLARRAPRWWVQTGIALVLLLVAMLLALSVSAGRSEAIDRLLRTDVGSDMRMRALPTLASLVTRYFPWGSGIGSFDAVFRIVEPFDVLKPTYFNHAHDDYVEVLIEAGLPGAVILLGALAWFLTASWKAWRGRAHDMHHARAGSVVIVLVLIASATDYPARTPLIMATLAVAASWLCPPFRPAEASRPHGAPDSASPCSGGPAQRTPEPD